MCSPQEAGASSNASTAANRGASEKIQPSRSPVSPSGTACDVIAQRRSDGGEDRVWGLQVQAPDEQ